MSDIPGMVVDRIIKVVGRRDIWVRVGMAVAVTAHIGHPDVITLVSEPVPQTTIIPGNEK